MHKYREIVKPSDFKWSCNHSWSLVKCLLMHSFHETHMELQNAKGKYQ